MIRVIHNQNKVRSIKAKQEQPKRLNWEVAIQGPAGMLIRPAAVKGSTR